MPMPDITAVHLDTRSIVSYHPTVAREKDTAIEDLLVENDFHPTSGLPGPYQLLLGIEDNRLLFEVTSETEGRREQFRLPTSPFRSLIKDYFLICESYYHALTDNSPQRIEAIDMGRRGLHDQGAETLRETLKPNVRLDFETARRLFTLVCVLHIRDQHRVLV
jgi:uncharacterized protein (UPF0262 family)